MLNEDSACAVGYLQLLRLNHVILRVVAAGTEPATPRVWVSAVGSLAGYLLKCFIRRMRYPSLPPTW
jgi:hypothetical protein